MKRNCAFEKYFNRDLANLKEWILVVWYPIKIVKKQIKRVVIEKKDKTQEGSTKGVAFVVTIYPKFTLFC